MAISEQFAGLDMKNLIGGPLSAAADSSIMLARSTAQFINEVGFDKDNKTRNVLFKYTHKTPDPDGNISENEMAIDVPLLAIVPIPNLQIDEVNVLFDMEVKTSEKSESSSNMSAEVSASARIGPFSFSIKGSVAASSSNTRSSDNSAKYHVDVRATNHGIPEGLARVLDMMAAAVSPSVIGSKPVDSSGNELKGDAKAKNLKLKQLREERFRLEDSEKSAQDNYQLKLNVLKDSAKNFKDKKAGEFEMQIKNAKTEDEKKPITASMNKSEIFWGDFISGIGQKITANSSAENAPVLQDLYGKADDSIPDLTFLNADFGNAFKAMKDLNVSTKKLNDNKTEYNSTMIK